MINTNALSQKYLSSSARAAILKTANKIIEIRNFTVDRFFLKKLKQKKLAQSLRSVYKELHADHETGAADNK
ncbi:hypothetical protein LEA_16049 [human gut metagenome]|uniref:Uncharacterized protein n=1 Tax=human gut metagenome TaxID=408170 RepID=K1T3P5_9ZZZZ